MSISVELHTNSVKVLYLYRKLTTFSCVSFNLSSRSINVLIRFVVDRIIHSSYVTINYVNIFIIWRISILVITNLNSRLKRYHVDLVSFFVHALIKLSTRRTLRSIFKHWKDSHLVVHRKILEYIRSKLCRTIAKVSHLKRE
nr:MAG TPA: hypothetical protein [Bacteriophage sp.]